MIFHGLPKRLFFVVLTPAAVVALGLTLIGLGLRYGDVEAALLGRAATVARQVAVAGEQALATGNTVELTRLVRTASSAEDVNVAIADAAGHVLARSDLELPAAWPRLVDSGPPLQFVALVRNPAAVVLGSVTAGFPAETVASRKREILVTALLAALVMLAAAVAIAKWFVGIIAAHVASVERTIDTIRSGRYDVRLPAPPGGSLERIETGINDLAATLESGQRQTARALAEREAELARQLGFAQAMLDAQSDSGIGLAIIEHGKIVFANQAVEAITGYRLEELRGLDHFVQLAHPDDRELIMHNHLQRLAGADFASRYDFTLLRKDGDTRHVQMAQSAIAVDNHMQVLNIFVDITDRKQTESQLAETHRQLLARNTDAERASIAKLRFFAAASHDLRQPLHALMLFTAELEAAAVTADQKRLSGQIGTATGAMGELLDALLEVSMLDTSGVTPHQKAVALGPLLEKVADSHRQSAAAKGLRLTCMPTQAWARTDPHFLRRLVSNLVANAIRYTSHGGIVIGVRRQGRDLRIEVRDTGVGIAAEHLPHIFQEFYQVGNIERDMAKGLGLGLAIVDRLAHLLEHTIQVRSTPRRGSVFALSLARATPVAEPAPRQSEPPRHAARILVAGDPAQPEIESMGNLLEHWGYRVLRADNERLLRTHIAAMPDVVVCDERFADPLAQALAGRPRPRPRLVLLGELAGSHPPRNLFFDARLPKPVKPGRLRALLRHLVEESSEEVV